MSTFGQMLTSMAGQMAAQTAGYKPGGMVEWGHDLAQIGPMLTNVAGVLNSYGHGADDLPVDDAVKEAISSVEAMIHQCASSAREIETTFRQVHETELARLEKPRPNEQMWDVGQNK